MFWPTEEVEWVNSLLQYEEILFFVCPQVKQLYQGVMEKMRGLQPSQGAVAVGGKMGCLERQVEQEIARRKVLGTQISQLLDSQLQILRNESQSQHAMHMAFSALLRQCIRLLILFSDSRASLSNEHIQLWYVSCAH